MPPLLILTKQAFPLKVLHLQTPFQIHFEWFSIPQDQHLKCLHQECLLDVAQSLLLTLQILLFQSCQLLNLTFLVIGRSLVHAFVVLVLSFCWVLQICQSQLFTFKKIKVCFLPVFLSSKVWPLMFICLQYSFPYSKDTSDEVYACKVNQWDHLSFQ